jgi:hypothetical protein
MLARAWPELLAEFPVLGATDTGSVIETKPRWSAAVAVGLFAGALLTEKLVAALDSVMEDSSHWSNPRSSVLRVFLLGVMARGVFSKTLSWPICSGRS